MSEELKSVFTTHRTDLEDAVNQSRWTRDHRREDLKEAERRLREAIATLEAYDRG